MFKVLRPRHVLVACEVIFQAAIRQGWQVESLKACGLFDKRTRTPTTAEIGAWLH